MRSPTEEEQKLFNQMWDQKIHLEADKLPNSICDEDLVALMEKGHLESIYDGLEVLLKRAGIPWKDTRPPGSSRV